MTQENVAKLPQTQERPKKKLVEKFADKFGVEAGGLMTTLKSTCFKGRDNKAPSNEEMMALLIVADQYGLNPFTREIFAFPDKQNGIVPVVGVDGWSRIINEHKALNGIEFRYAEKMTTMQGARACPEWCEAVIYRKDREHPTVVREYLDEVYRKPFSGKNGPINGPWQTHTKRFLRHKALIQAARIAFGFAGIYDEDEARDMIDITPESHDAPARPTREDFTQKTADMHTLLDEFGESMGEFSEQDMVEQAVAKIEGFTERDTLEAFWEHNEGFEAFPPRSDVRMTVASAYNAARENLHTEQNLPQDDTVQGAAQEPDEGWETWSDNLIAKIQTITDHAFLVRLWAEHEIMLEALNDEAPALHTAVLNATDTRAAELSAQQEQE